MTSTSEKMPPKKVATSCTTPEPAEENTPSSEESEARMELAWLPLFKKSVACAIPSAPLGTCRVSRYCGTAERKPVASMMMGGKKKYTRQKMEPSTNTYIRS